MNEFQREVAEVQWLLSRMRHSCNYQAPWYGEPFGGFRVRGEIVQISDRQLAMFRRGEELWPARVRVASHQMRSLHAQQEAA